jgi:NAD-specific glutamate dehydrogenase
MFPACEVVAVAEQIGVEVLDAAAIYFALDAGLQLGHLRDLLLSATPRTPWDRLALSGLYDDVVDEHRRLAIQALTRSQLATRAGAQDLGPAEAVEQRVRQWLGEEVVGYGRWQQVLAEIDAQSAADVAMLAVAVRALNGLDSRQAA